MHNSDTTRPQFDIQSWLQTHSEKVQEVFASYGVAQKPIDVQVHSKNQFCFVLKISSADIQLRAKVFNPIDRMSTHYSSREITLLSAMNETDLAPNLYAGSVEEKWYISDWVPGEDVSHSANDDTIVGIAHEVGVWLAQYAAEVTKSPQLTTNDPETFISWRDYLSKYGGLIEKIAQDPEGDFLADLMVEKRMVAKDDPHMGNYIRRSDGKILGIDFEMASLRPFGWDILITARYFLRAWPGPRLAHIDALLEGWGQGTDCLDKEDFRRIVVYFAEKTAHDLNAPPVEALRTILHAHNSRTKTPAAKIVQIPAKDAALEDVKAGVRESLRDHIKRAMQEEALPLSFEPPATGGEGTGQAATAAVDAWMASTCAACQGSCCSFGAEYNAYLKKDAIYRSARHLGTQSLEEVIDAYVERVPDRHVTNSCFFHTHQGCNLPREMRSTTCNTHLCAAVKSISALRKEVAPETPILVVSGKPTAPARALTITQNTTAPVDLKALGFGTK